MKTLGHPFYSSNINTISDKWEVEEDVYYSRFPDINDKFNIVGKDYYLVKNGELYLEKGEKIKVYKNKRDAQKLADKLNNQSGNVPTDNVHFIKDINNLKKFKLKLGSRVKFNEKGEIFTIIGLLNGGEITDYALLSKDYTIGYNDRSIEDVVKMYWTCS